MAKQTGKLLIVGGSEDREDDMQVLSKFVELSGGADSSIIVLTAATTVPGKIWAMYDRAFDELGVRHRAELRIEHRKQADDPELVAKILGADGIFMSGGGQQRLVALLGGSEIHAAMLTAFREHGACIGGTSAGASAMSRYMLAHGSKEMLPDKNTAQIEAGLGLLQHVIIDQHFSQRHRLARLLSCVAQNPEAVGVGIDEDTALVIHGRNRIEVIGNGAVTLLDGRRMRSNFDEADARQPLELLNVTLHLLPAGSCYGTAEGREPPADVRDALRDILALVTGI